MKLYSPEKMTGVGALIVSTLDPERGFLTVVERRTKRSTHKLAGMRSLPMETVLRDENRLQGWRRLFQEEIQARGLNLPELYPGAYLGQFELNPGVVLYAHVQDIPSDMEMIIGSEAQEVDEIGWTTFNEVMRGNPDDFNYRTGVREVIAAYATYRQDPLNYSPVSKKSSELQGRVPSRVFDLVEAGFRVPEALSLYRHSQQPSVARQTLIHSI